MSYLASMQTLIVTFWWALPVMCDFLIVIPNPTCISTPSHYKHPYYKSYIEDTDIHCRIDWSEWGKYALLSGRNVEHTDLEKNKRLLLWW